MAKEISLAYTASLNLYVIIKTAVGTYVNVTTPEAFNSANWGSYAIALTEYASATGQYHGDFPALPAGIYSVEVYLRAGGSPALIDGPPIAEGEIQWAGTAEFVPLAASAIATAIWQDAVSGDFTAANSIGRSLYTSGNVPGTSGGNLIAGANAATTIAGLAITSSSTYALTVQSSAANFAGAFFGGGASGAGISATGGTGASGLNLTAGTNASGMLSTGNGTGDGMTLVKGNTGFCLKADIHGTVDAATNLTNSPTSGDFTSTMKTSLSAATPTVTVSDKTGFSLNLAQTGLSPRNLGSVADASLTVGDAFVAAICAAAGRQTIVGTAYSVETPSTATLVRQFVLDSSSSPTSRT